METENNNENAAPNKMGPPSKYSEAIVDEICEIIATSNKGLKSILSTNPLFPSFSTFFKWLGEKDKQYLSDRYARAKELQAEYMADQILEIADDGSNDTYVDENGKVKTDWDVLGRSKLRVDSRKWLASKLLPKKFGDKIDVTTQGEKIVDVPVINWVKPLNDKPE